jgi:hypothetical protein
MTPSQLDQYVTAQQNAVRDAGNRESCRVAYWDARTSRADHWIYTAAWIGIPVEYCDPTHGIWHVPEDICWACWKPIEGPVVREMCNAECRHYHPACRSGHDSRLWEGEHCWSCKSLIPCYVA